MDLFLCPRRPASDLHTKMRIFLQADVKFPVILFPHDTKFQWLRISCVECEKELTVCPRSLNTFLTIITKWDKQNNILGLL